jgi:hypothetical protein
VSYAIMRKYLVCMCIFALFGDIAFAQEKISVKESEKLLEEAQKAYQNKEYPKSIQNYLEALTFPELEEGRASILYNVSCCYSLIGNADSAFKYLDESIKAGNTDYRWMGKDADFDFLRKNYPERFEATMALAQVAEKNEILTKSPITVVEYDNYTGPTDISKYIWDDFNDPKMDTLRERYQLHKIVESGKTEFEKMKQLLDWVSNRWEHKGDNMAKERNALAILAEVEKGERFCCANYADVLDNCMTALGYPARFVGLMRKGAAYGSGKGHGCVEVWSNQYQKWILLDGQNDAWWESDSIPLSAYECRHLFVNGKEDEMKFVGQHKEFDYSAMKPEWTVYFYHLGYSYDNSYFDTVSHGQSLWFRLVSDGIIPELFNQGWPEEVRFTDDYEEAYPRLNQTKVTLKHTNRDTPSDTLKVILTHTMPYFDKFMVRINGSNWKESSDTFIWVLTKGDNSIEAKAVNLAGIEGRPSRIVLRNNIGTLGR